MDGWKLANLCLKGELKHPGIAIIYLDVKWDAKR